MFFDLPIIFKLDAEYINALMVGESVWRIGRFALLLIQGGLFLDFSRVFLTLGGGVEN